MRIHVKITVGVAPSVLSMLTIHILASYRMLSNSVVDGTFQPFYSMHCPEFDHAHSTSITFKYRKFDLVCILLHTKES